ncbi:MAG TPA: amidohydrolase family protein [Acidimicrobiales bacterium]|nr:amidohydrolase family protein [Acidimicrobiales bacterium]
MTSPHPLTVDLHAHVFPPQLPELGAETGDDRWPRLVVTDDQVGEIRRGGSVFRVVQAPLWDIGRRLAVMDDHHVDVQVVSPMPIALTYWSDPGLAARYARAFNDGVAGAVAASNGKLRGLGTVPLQDPALAIAEMRRATGELQLDGIEIGTVVNGRELSDESLRGFFRAAAEGGVPLFVHPIDGGGATRCSSPVIDFAIGMHTDTALSTYALVYGGVLEELTDLRVCLSHGGGAFPWTHPRLGLFDSHDRKVLDTLVRRLWADALVFDPRHLPLLVERYGADHIALGSDYPFIPPDVHDPVAMLAEAEASGAIDGSTRSAILGANALAFLAR